MMRKRFLSLTCALVLCLGLLPATALAAAPPVNQVLYVGGVLISSTGYWTTSEDGKTLTSVTSVTESDNYIHYDAGDNTLTLHNATIKKGLDYSEGIQGGTYIPGSAIGILNLNGDAELTIQLEGSNTIAEVSQGIYVLAHSQSTGSSSLTIKGNGSLDTSSSQIGIRVQSNSNDAALSIENAKVTATVVDGHDGNGVFVQSSENSSVSLTVNSGSLTATGRNAYDTGILLQFGSGGSGSGTPTVTVSGNAVVDAKNGGIANNSSSPIQYETGSDSTGGIVFDGNTGTVYGAVTLQEDLEIGEGESLNIPSGASLNTDGKLTVDGGTLTGNVTGTVNYKVTGVSLSSDTLTLDVGGTATLTATVLPDNATNKRVTWTSSDETVATVTDGLVTALKEGTATITVTTEDGSKTATCVVTVTAATVPVTGVTLSQTQASLYYNRTPNTLTLTATVAPDNATNQAVTWTSSDSTVAAVDQNGVVTALARGTAVITATTADGGKTASCTVTVSRYSSGGGSSSSSTSLSDRAIDDIQDARPGDTVEITLRPGRTTLEREVFEELAGQDITLEIDAGDGVLWTVNGLDIPEDTRLHDLDLDVDLGDSGIPATVLNAVTGEIGTVQLSLAHDEEFGFTMTLSAPLGRDNADYWANLYWYNERTEDLEFQQAARIAKDGTAEFELDHASDYAIVIDDRSHEPVDLPFNDVPEGYWAYDAIQYVYGEGLMAGTSGSTFSPEGTTTRGQIVTILWRLSGSPVVNYLMDFDDVDPAAYYAEAIRWATSEGIAGGYGGGVFGPDDPITREQLAVMLHRYAQHQGCDVSIGEDTNILSYADAFDVSEYAVSALQWACGAGIISGTGDGSTLTPQGEATRAQAAVMLTRFCEEYVTW